MRLQIPGLVCALGLVAPSLTHASAPPEGETGDRDTGETGDRDTGETDRDTGDTARAEPSTKKWNPRTDRPWIKRWAPEPHMLELGIYGGLFLLNSQHELFRPDLSLPLQGWEPLRELNPDVGARFGYYPLRFFGIEAEGGPDTPIATNDTKAGRADNRRIEFRVLTGG